MACNQLREHWQKIKVIVDEDHGTAHYFNVR